MLQESEVPEGWVSLTIQDVCDINPPKPKKGDIPDDASVTFVPMPAVDAEHGEISSPEIRPFSEVRSGFTAFRDGDVIMAKITPCMENGKAAVAGGLVSGLGFGSTEFFVLRSNGSILPQYLFHHIRQVSFRELAESNMTGSVGQKRVPKEFIANAAIPLPPLAEQHRIVAAVEALFARLDAANARLERVPGILKRFRQTVLAAACDGRLTEDWRAESPEIEDANQLLSIITKTNQKSNLSKKSQVIISEESKEIPSTWVWTRLGSVLDLTSGIAFKKNEYSENGVRLLQIANVTFGKIIWGQEAFLPENYTEKYPNLVLKSGDLLMALNRPLLGDYLKIAFLTSRDAPAILYQRVGRFDFYHADLKKYVYTFLNSPRFIEKLRADLRGVDQPFVTKRNLLRISIPLPPLPEQHEIVRRVDALFALADKIEAEVAAARAKTETMRQSILAQAFSGRLVPTEAELARQEAREYEPASVLLERICSEKKEKKGRKGVQSTLV